MKTKTLALVIIASFLLMVAMIPMNAKAWIADSFPRMDDIYSVICSDETVMMTKARGGEIDNVMDVRQPSNVEELETDLSWSISANPAYSIHISNVNCRDYYPETAGEVYDYHGRLPGDSNYPLNTTEFRFVLKLLISGSQMQSWCSEVFAWTQIPLDTVITPAHGYWYNTEMTVYGYEPALALTILEANGWSNSTGHWITPKGIELRHVYVLCCIEAEHSTSAISMRECAAWNEFFGLHSDATPYFVDESLAVVFNTLIDITFYDRDFDISSHGWGLGKNPDYLYDFFSPEVDVPWGDNACGFSDPEIDEKEYAVKYWRWPNGTYITELADMIDLVWDVQTDLYYVEPFLVTYCSIYVNAYAPGVKDWKDSLGYGSDISYTYYFICWDNPAATSIRMCVSSDINTLNPGWVSTVYDHQVLDRVEDALWDVEPYHHVDVMWASDSWTTEPWIDMGIGVEYGQKVTFTIRPDIYWHDGQAFTAEDVKYSFDFIKNLTLAQYATIVTTYVYSNVVDPNTVEVYMNCTGLWYIYDYAGAGALFPEQIWSTYWNDPVNAEIFQPWNTNYDTFTGSSGHGALTCLIGIGAYIFVEWDEVTGVCHLVANRPDAVWTGNPGWFAQNFRREDINFDGIVDIFDAVKLAAAAGATSENPRWNYGEADINADGVVDIFDAVRLAGKAGYLTLPIL